MADLDWSVFEDHVAFLVAAKLPWLDQKNIAFANPQTSFKPSGDAADADFAVHAAHFHATAANALFAHANDLVLAWDGCASEKFFLVLLCVADWFLHLVVAR